jgi:type VI secretion system protein ImpB
MTRFGTDSKLKKERPARVVFDIPMPDGVEKTELPFVIGVLADLGSNPGKKRDSLRDRNFTEITKDNFDKVLGEISPQITIKVPNLLRDESSGEPEEISATITIKSMADFEPQNIAKQVPALAALLDQREKLEQILANAEVRPQDYDALQALFGDERVKKLFS